MHGSQRQTLGQPKLPERHDAEEDDHHGQPAASGDDHAAEDDIEQGEEREGYEHPRLQPWVPADQVAWASHADKSARRRPDRPWTTAPILRVGKTSHSRETQLPVRNKTPAPR